MEEQLEKEKNKYIHANVLNRTNCPVSSRQNNYEKLVGAKILEFSKKRSSNWLTRYTIFIMINIVIFIFNIIISNFQWFNISFSEGTINVHIFFLSKTHQNFPKRDQKNSK